MDFNFDFISFFIGLLAGFGISFVLYRLRHQIGRLRQQATESTERARTFATRTASSRYQIDLAAFCEQYHMAGHVVGLSRLAIEPRFITGVHPYDNSIESQRNVFRIVPMVHEFPASYASFNLQTLSIADLGASDRHLALLGQPGSGRSAALAAIALWVLGRLEFAEQEDLVQRNIDEEEAQISDKEREARAKEREEMQARALEQIKRAQEQAAEALLNEAVEATRPPTVNLHQLMPILVHLGDIEIDGESAARLDPAEPLVKAMTQHLSRITSMTVPRYVYNRLNDGQALVLIDGLDDLPAGEQRTKLAWLRHFLATYTECMVIVAGPAVGYHPLLQLGMTPVFLRPWTDLDARTYVEHWADAWPQAFKRGRQTAPAPDERVVARAAASTRGLTPLDLTMRVLAAFSADEKQPGRWGWYDAFVARSFKLKAFESSEELFDEAIYAAAEIAAEILQHGALTLDRITEIATELFRETSADGKKETFILDIGQFTNALTTRSGLMRRSAGERYDFRHPMLRSFLASETLLDEDDENVVASVALDPAWKYAVSFAAARVTPTQMNRAVVVKLSRQPDLLYNNLFDVVYWLPDAQANASWRGEIFKRLAAALIAPSQFPALRARAMAALVATRGNSILFILRQGLRSPEALVRRLSCLGLGALGNSEAIKDLGPMLQDDDLDVQLAAGLALGAIGTERALEVVVEGLLTGEESLRQAVAETLAAIPGQGHQLLHKAIESQDMMVRRAAVFGLARVQTPWALTDMYRAMLEDSQWYVRSAAEQAFAEAQIRSRNSAHAHPPLESVEWLVDWAAEKGEGVPAGENARALLVRVLQEGDPAARIASAQTLGAIGYAPALKPLYYTLQDRNDQVRAAVYKALADLQMQIGQPLPGIN